MNKCQQLLDKLSSLTNVYGNMRNEGVSRETIGIVSSLESEFVPNYPLAAYTDTPSKTHLTCSLEGVFSVIIKGILDAIKYVFNLVGKFINYILRAVGIIKPNDFEKQIKNNVTAHQYYADVIKKAKEKEKSDTKPKMSGKEHFLIQIGRIDNHESEDLALAKDRLNANYTLLVESIHSDIASARKILPRLDNITKINALTATLTGRLEETTEAINKEGFTAFQASGKTTGIRDAFNLYISECYKLNKDLATAKLKYVTVRKYPRDDMDYYNPSIYIRDVANAVRLASNTPSKQIYTDTFIDKTSRKASDRVSKTITAYFNDLIKLFQSDKLIKEHDRYVKLRAKLKTFRDKIQSKGVSPDEVKEFNELLNDYIKSVTIVLTYSIRMRQIPKTIASSCLRFMNSESSYLKIKADKISEL